MCHTHSSTQTNPVHVSMRNFKQTDLLPSTGQPAVEKKLRFASSTLLVKTDFGGETDYEVKQTSARGFAAKWKRAFIDKCPQIQMLRVTLGWYLCVIIKLLIEELLAINQGDSAQLLRFVAVQISGFWVLCLDMFKRVTYALSVVNDLFLSLLSHQVSNIFRGPHV